jgi:glycosyltransferase involved in cell wall biosynthesis
MREFRTRKAFRDIFDKYGRDWKPDIVLLPFADYCLYAIGMIGSPFGGIPWVGITMRPTFHHRRLGIKSPRDLFSRAKEALFLRVLKSTELRCLFSIDDTLVSYIRSVAKGRKDKIEYLPPPLHDIPLLDPARAKRELGIDPANFVVLLYGTIVRRKGVDQLLRVLRDGRLQRKVVVVLAGQASGDIRRRILSLDWVRALIESGTLLVLDRHINEEEESLVYSAANVIWLGYVGHYASSGILMQARRLGKPVIACEEGMIGWETKRDLLGVTFQRDDLEGVAGHINAFADGNRAGGSQPANMAVSDADIGDAHDVFLARFMNVDGFNTRARSLL